jgi:hypothetical protein
MNLGTVIAARILLLKSPGNYGGSILPASLFLSLHFLSELRKGTQYGAAGICPTGNVDTELLVMYRRTGGACFISDRRTERHMRTGSFYCRPLSESSRKLTRTILV